MAARGWFGISLFNHRIHSSSRLWTQTLQDASPLDVVRRVGVSRAGLHLVMHWSLTRSVVTLSSAEAGLTGITKGASISLGLATVAKVLGWDWPLVLESDATAAIGIARRRGLGKIRHLATADLWIQDRLRTHYFSL